MNRSGYNHSDKSYTLIFVFSGQILLESAVSIEIAYEKQDVSQKYYILYFVFGGVIIISTWL